MDSGNTVSRRSIIKMTGAALVVPAVPVSAQDLEKRRMAFAPTFSDLVRNYTTTTGPGNFMLGDAVTGYRSFASAVKPGDNFYYSAVGIDRPSEFEVGRGTLQADGTISRDPLTGVPTDFSNGYKTVALIAAAEWYQTVQAGSALAATTAQTRGALAGLADKSKPVLLGEWRREGVFVFDPSDLSAQVKSDPLQGVYVGPDSAPGGASGAWVRRFEGPLIASWFGAVGNAATDDHSAIQAALDFAAGSWMSVLVPTGTFLLSRSLSIPDGVALEGTGNATMLYSINGGAGDPWLIKVSGGADLSIRNFNMVPDNSGAPTRAAIQLDQCSRVSIENVSVEGQTNATGIFLFDCDNCVVDELYFDGGAEYQGNGVVASGCQDCKFVNCHAVNCFAGFVLSGYDIDGDVNPLGAAARSSADSYGNTVANCTVRKCTTQAFNANSSRNNVFANCHAEDYAGASTHKAFQAKDPGTGPEAGKGTRGNIFISCTVNNYPGGFGGQLGADTQIIGCSAKGISNRFIDLNGVTAPIVDACSVDGFAVGIWVGGGTVLGKFDNVTLETSIPNAVGIQCAADGNNGSNNFDNVTTTSSLAKFIDIASTCTNNRFGPGCRSNSQAISDGSNSSTWPMIYRTDLMDLTASASLQYGPYLRKQIQVVRATFVVTATITGSPQVSAGVLGSNTAYTAATAVSGSAGAAVNLPVANATSANANILQGRVAAPGTAGKGFVQFEGLPLL